MTWNIHCCLPVRTSKPRTSPGGISAAKGTSLTFEPITTTSRQMIGDSVQMAIDSTAQLLRQVNAPLATEGANRLARLRVQADQIAVTGAKKDALIVTICPVGDAAMHEAIVGWRSVLPCLGVVDPPGLACRGVDGRDLGERGTDVENTADHQRSSFPNPSFQMIRFRDLLFGGAPCPRGSQAIEIAPAYLREK